MKMRIGLIFVLLLTVVAARATTRCVSLDGTNDSANGYDSWPGAATSIHSAVDVAQAGDMILVSNGTFNLTKQLVLNQAYTLKGVNGRDNAIINGQGAWNIKLGSGATIDGLTVSNGYTAGGFTAGGIYVSYADVGYIYNCRITGCLGNWVAGGLFVYGGASLTMTNCVIDKNTGYPPAVNIVEGLYGNVQIQGCTIANNVDWGLAAVYVWHGDASWAAGTMIWSDCIISNNAGRGLNAIGAGIFRNCLIVNNGTAPTQPGVDDGGVSIYGIQYVKDQKGGLPGQLVNCTIAGNQSFGVKLDGSGDYADMTNTLINCIIYSNFNGATPRDVIMTDPSFSSAFSYSCVTNVLPADQHCITDDPKFTDVANKNYHPRGSSHVINTGTTNDQSWLIGAVDLDGNPRILDGAVDMGCYETKLPPQGTILGIR